MEASRWPLMVSFRLVGTGYEAPGGQSSDICVGVRTCALCLGQLKLLQSMFAQVISGQVFSGHQSNHLQRARCQEV